MERPDTTAMLAEFDALVEINGRLMFAKANYNEGEAEAFGVRLLEFFNRHAIDLRAAITLAQPTPVIPPRDAGDGVAAQVITLRMAKANSADIDAAFEVASIMEALAKGYYPACESESDAPVHFNSDSFVHLEYLYERIRACEAKGSLYRVVGGMDMLLHPSNAVLDPDADYIKLHPRFTAQPAQSEFTDTGRAALAWVLFHHQGGSSPVGQPIRFALGMGQHDRMSDSQITEAKQYAAATQRTTADFHSGRPAEPARLGSAAHRLLDWQPLTHLNKGDRLWQILEHAGLPVDDQPAAIAALIEGAAA